MHHCTVEFDPRTEIVVGPVISNAEYSALAAEALNDILPEGNVSEYPKWYASLSMSMYL